MNRFLKIQFFLAALFATFAMQAATLKLATIAPEGSYWMNEMRAAAKEIKTKTDGRVKIKLYGGGVMGTEKAVLRKMRIGQLHGGTFTAGTMSTMYKDINTYGLPFLFQSHAEADYVRAKLDAEMLQGMKDAGFTTFGIATAGFGKLMAPERFEKIDDLKGKKLWVPEDDDMSFDILKKLGLSPVKLPMTDVMTGLQTKLLDVVGSPAVAAIALQWHTKVKYVYDEPLVYIYGMLGIDNKVFNKLKPEDQAVVTEVLTNVYKKFDQANRDDNKKAEQAMKGMNIEFVPANAEMADIIKQVEGINQGLIDKGMFSQQMYDKVQKYITEYRAQQ